MERVKLWRCPECGDQMLAKGHNDSLCEGNKYEGAAHLPVSGEEVTFVRLDEVIQMVEDSAAKEWQKVPVSYCKRCDADTPPLDVPDKPCGHNFPENSALHHVPVVPVSRLTDLAAQLKGTP